MVCPSVQRRTGSQQTAWWLLLSPYEPLVLSLGDAPPPTLFSAGRYRSTLASKTSVVLASTRELFYHLEIDRDQPRAAYEYGRRRRPGFPRLQGGRSDRCDIREPDSLACADLRQLSSLPAVCCGSPYMLDVHTYGEYRF